MPKSSISTPQKTPSPTPPNNTQRHLARWLHVHGVSLVIGSHPHVVQPVEYVTHDGDTTGITAYSLGNFISNQSRPGTDRGICRPPYHESLAALFRAEP